MKNYFHEKRKHHNRDLGFDIFFFVLLFVYIICDSFLQAFFDTLIDYISGGYTIISIIFLLILRLLVVGFFILIFILHEKSKSMDFLIIQKKNFKYKEKSDSSCLDCLYCNLFTNSNESNRVYCSFYNTSELLSDDKSKCKCRNVLHNQQHLEV